MGSMILQELRSGTERAEWIEGSGTGVIVSRWGEGGFLPAYVNATAARLLGLSKSEIEGCPEALLECFPVLDELRRARRSSTFGGVVPACGLDLRSLQGAVGYVERVEELVEVLFFCEAPAAPAPSVASTSTDRFKALRDVAPDAIALGTREKVLYANPATVELFEARSAEEIVGRPITDFVRAEDRAYATSIVRDVLVRGESRTDVELRMVTRRGRLLRIQLSAIRVKWQGQQVILAVGRDLTERQRVLAETAGADRLSAIGTLTAGIAHEVNNPLAYVLLNLQYLIQEIRRFDGSEAMTARLMERVGEAQHGARRVRGIVADLRNLARRGEARAAAPVSVLSALRTAVRVASSTFEGRAKLVEHYRSESLVVADIAKLEQIFVNLLVNAGQALASGDPARDTITVDLFDEGDGVVVTVADTGVGIPPDVLPRVFDPFFTTKPRGIGTGLGLPISYQIASSYGGELTAESQEGRGTTFRVWLPRSVTSDAEEASSPASPPLAPPWRARVLVIDDEALVSEMVSRVFGHHHDVQATTDPAEGLELALERDFDAVFCDLLMPGLSGMDVYEEIARRRPGFEKRIVFMTGGAFTDRAADFLAKVDNGRIVKPFEIADLERALRHAIEKNES
jgi:PAS domain S-box-containing protein